MKVSIVAINSKYIHTPLAPWYIKEACSSVVDMDVLVHSINEDIQIIYRDILKNNPDIVMFSCYIWNIEFVKKLSCDLKMTNTGIQVIWGGPEVSFNCKKILEDNPYVDIVVAGEGEESVLELLSGKDIDGIGGVCYRKDGAIVDRGYYRTVENLDSIPSPYTDKMLKQSEGRIMYYESTRGCPFSCSYCLSSVYEKVRCFSMDRVKEDIQKIVSAGFKQIKFVDRTFNCMPARAKEILRYVLSSTGDTSFHFEIAADLLDDEMIDILNSAPHGKIQVEAGVQTVNEKSLEEIDRKTDLDKLFNNISRVIDKGNVHVHLDLIAGLPYEDFESFKNSFNVLYNQKPHNLQLGFLKVLHGTKMEDKSREYKLSYREYAPYEVVSSNWISYSEINILKGVEDALERLYNSGRFILTLEYIISKYYSSPFDFYMEFSNEINVGEGIASNRLFEILYSFSSKFNDDKIYDLLKIDFFASTKSKKLPDCFETNTSKQFNEQCFEFLKDEDNVAKFLPHFKDVPAKEIYKKVHFEKIGDTIYIFDYEDQDKVTGRYNYTPLKKWPFV